MTLKYEWICAYASVIGTSHVRNNMPCQDTSECKIVQDMSGEKVLVAVVSDGAGSAKFSDQGSSLACSLFVKEVSRYLGSGKTVKDLDRPFIENWIDHFQKEISLEAKKLEVSSREFACTILAAIVGNDCAAFFQVGDGAIVILNPESETKEETYEHIFWPDKGEFENTTYFITDPMVKKNIMFDPLDRRVEEISLFTDGIQHLTLHYQSQTVHNPFFKPMFKSIRSVDKKQVNKLNLSLEAFLNSERINEKTDDDKTLLLATRRGVGDHGHK